MDHSPSSNPGSSLGVLGRLALLVALLPTLSLPACRNGNDTENDTAKAGTTELVPFTVRIDWVPSAEYYGFFYAREKGYYEEAGLDVEISYGSGAPVVAKELATGAAYAASTTSASILREIAGGAEFSRAAPIFRFNPSALVSLADAPVRSLSEVPGKTIGVNKQSTVYEQFQYLLGEKDVSPSAFDEYPIGWGGAEQLILGEVDATLAYTTNHVVDIELRGREAVELTFDELGVNTFGLVIAIASDEILGRKGIKQELAERFIEATLRGYTEGAKDIAGAVAALKKTEPTLDEKKLRAAIEKIRRLNDAQPSTTENVDRWLVESAQVTEDDLLAAIGLYER